MMRYVENKFGKIDATWFDYNKDGSVPKEPTYHRIVDGGICYFYIAESDEKNIIDQMEFFSHFKVLIRNSQEVSQ